MKKIALSLFVIAASGAYLWQQARTAPVADLVGSSAPPVAPQAAPVDPPHRVRTSAVAPSPATVPSSSFVVTTQDVPPPSAPAAVSPPQSTRRERLARVVSSTLVTPAAVTVAANGSYADGSYTGPAEDAYYGSVQVEAVVQGGRLTDIKVLQYPSDRRTSVAINRQALPMLRDEVITAQSAEVDVISGATLTSEAFIASLDQALRQATTT